MTAALFTGKARRTTAALGVAAAGLLVLSACDKPTPRATVTVGSTSVNAEANCYDADKGIAEKDMKACLNKKPAETVKLSLEDTLRLGVDPEVAENGWSLFLNGEQAEREPYKKTYRTLPGSAFFGPRQDGSPAPKEVVLSIVETGSNKLIGSWNFKLEKAA
ncbi:DUF2771 domain-containing protein [Streptomyces sp. NPDC087440]|uniref:DUF2771 domain-containing protein n=1 Tax=Streptomyces sp. NPDC087440 TaxID=3365790 RepID=UPI0038304BDF